MIKRFWADERAVSMPEYAMIMAIIALASAGAITLMRGQLVAVFRATGEPIAGTGT
jgi:Flp pilus assembly pilin Flp